MSELGPFALPIALGTALGGGVRLLLLRVDYRQYPSYPHDYLVHLSLGLIAALTGAVILPALLSKDFTAVTFLLLVATQFREIRKVEREQLQHMEEDELVPRGPEYIEGIARLFEARNYLVIGVAIAASGAALAGGWPWGLAAGAVAGAVAQRWKSGRLLGEVAEVSAAPLRFDGPTLYVGSIYMMNVAVREVREQIERWGVGILLRPKEPGAHVILADTGQRNAILHDVTSRYGLRKDVGTPEFTPLARKDQESGVLALYLTPMVRDVDGILETVRRTPLLESSRGSASTGRRRGRPGRRGGAALQERRGGSGG